MAAMVATMAGVSSLRSENTSTATSSTGPIRSDALPAASDTTAPAVRSRHQEPRRPAAATAIAAKPA